MALENILERIAVALETLVEQGVPVEIPIATAEDIAAASESLVTTSSRGKAEGPATSEPPQDPSPAGVELDPRGLPWDARINTVKRTKLVSGDWKLTRGVDPALVAQVEAELRAAMQNITPSIPDSSIPGNGVSVGAPVNSSAGPMTLPELQHAAQDVVRQLGPRLNEVAGVLQQYGATELSGLAPEHYDNFLASINNLLAPPA